MPLVLAAPDDCGGLLALPFLDDEPGVGVQRGGTALVVGLQEHQARWDLLTDLFEKLREAVEGLAFADISLSVFV